MASLSDLTLHHSRRAFLQAEWRRLCLLTYQVEPTRLTRFLPPGLSLDLRNGHAHLSLVAFEFLRTKVLGVAWPGFRNFPEINLRFYVREGERRGVVFIREFVPSRLIALLARRLYNEPYVRAPMRACYTIEAQQLHVEHRIGDNLLSLRAHADVQRPPETSTAHFFKEHSWGYGVSRQGTLLRYEVRHPVWNTYPVIGYDLRWDFGKLYGDEWADLSSQEPVSVILAEGSAIAVSPVF